jgi:hypothetical protein
MSELLQELLDCLEVKRIDTYLFTGNSPETAAADIWRPGTGPEPECRQPLDRR